MLAVQRHHSTEYWPRTELSEIAGIKSSLYGTHTGILARQDAHWGVTGVSLPSATSCSAPNDLPWVIAEADDPLVTANDVPKHWLAKLTEAVNWLT